MTVQKQLSVVGLVLALVVVLLAAGKILLKNELEPVGVGIDAPGFSAVTLDSVPQTRTLADYRGKVVMINIWATWCLPCRVEMPSIEKLHQAYAGKDLKIIGISVDDPGTDAQIRDFVKQYDLTFEVLHDTGGQDGRVSRDYQTTGYPETIVIGRDGIIRKKFLGASDWNSAENRALIDRLLAEKAD
jgi:cytochrome c biogenesis protein CcmG/thiol:disulfide interchange protein DsbE